MLIILHGDIGYDRLNGTPRRYDCSGSRIQLLQRPARDNHVIARTRKFARDSRTNTGGDAHAHYQYRF
jgi:hypothetical protein